MRFPELKPFMKEVGRNVIFLTKTFNGTAAGKVITKNRENENKPVRRIRDDDIGKNGMRVFTTVAHDSCDAEIISRSVITLEIDELAAVIIMNMAVTAASTDGTGFQSGLKCSHEGIKNRF